MFGSLKEVSGKQLAEAIDELFVARQGVYFPWSSNDPS